jgi:hypothetical protein
MAYQVSALKQMIVLYNDQLTYPSASTTVERIAELVYRRRVVAAMIENEGEPVTPVTEGPLAFDKELYDFACFVRPTMIRT